MENYDGHCIAAHRERRADMTVIIFHFFCFLNTKIK